MEMKHYVLGFLFGPADDVLLTRKNEPDWQKGFWNGIGGKIEDSDKNPENAMNREFYEELCEWSYTPQVSAWGHCITFTCPGGTVFVFRAYTAHWKDLPQLNDVGENLYTHSIHRDPALHNQFPWLQNLAWMIPLAKAKHIHLPVMINQTELGCKE